MAMIKMLDEDTDFSELNMSKVGWDVTIYDEPHDVYLIEGYVHSIGGRWGENAYWCCEMGETPSYQNLSTFSGEPVQFGIEYLQKNYVKIKWGDSNVRSKGLAVIKRNGEVIYSIRCNSVGYGLAKAQTLLLELQEGPIDIFQRDYKQKLVGQKVWYENQAGIISKVLTDEEFGIELFIVPDKSKIEKFVFPTYGEGDYEWVNEWENGLRCDIFESNIKWFRED